MKWVLITILIGSIMMISYKVSEQYKDKFNFYTNLKSFLDEFKLNLSFKQIKIADFLKGLKYNSDFKMFITEYQNYLNSGEFNLGKIKTLDSEDIIVLENIIKNIGQYDSANEEKQIDDFLIKINKNLEIAEKNKNKLCPMIIKLSLLFSIGLAILLV